jgi:osmotically-inducible protein OsmY
MTILRGFLAFALFAFAAMPACKQEPARTADDTVREDVKDVAKATGKAVKDFGNATVEAADKAGQGLAEASSEVGASGKDAWITTKVKSELAANGFDPLRLHVDTQAKIVTLSGTVDSADQKDKAVALARGVKDVASVADHLFVGKAR